MKNRITITINGRTVYWDLEPQQAALFMQALIASLGPADGDLDA
jgi:hypothetical protein